MDLRAAVLHMDYQPDINEHFNLPRSAYLRWLPVPDAMLVIRYGWALNIAAVVALPYAMSNAGTGA